MSDPTRPQHPDQEPPEHSRPGTGPFDDPASERQGGPGHAADRPTPAPGVPAPEEQANFTEQPPSPEGYGQPREEGAYPQTPVEGQPYGQQYGQQHGQHQGQQQGQQYGQQYAEPGRPTPDEVTWGCAAHWSALVASVIALAFLGPLIVMLTKGNQSGYVRRQAVESLNFQLSILIYGIVSFVLVFVLIGFVLLPVVGLLWLVFTIIGTVRSARGEEYRYPLTIRMVS